MSESLSKLKFKRVGLSNPIMSDIYYWVLKSSWTQFLSASVIIYLLFNAFFAAFYFFSGELITNADPDSYWQAFVFSFQTSSTIGYGFLRPANDLAHIIVIFDTLSGLLFVAILTGLAFAKFTRPISKVMFSEKVLIGVHDGKKTLMLRMGNGRSTHIAEANVSLAITKDVTTQEGKSFRRFQDLKVHRSNTPFFNLTWTVFHTIDESSPLYELDKNEIQEQNISLVLSFTGIDDVYAQTVHANYLYRSYDFEFNKHFADMISKDEKNEVVIDFNKFDELV